MELADRRKAVARLWDSHTLGEIANELNISTRTVWNDVCVLGMNGLKKPGQSQRAKNMWNKSKHKRTISSKLKGNKHRLGQKHAKSTIIKMREQKTGPDNPNWRGGFSATTRNCSLWEEFRAKVVARDGNKCVRCGVTGYLAVHHKIPERVRPDLVYAMSNCKTLCPPCRKNADDEYRTQESIGGVS